MSHHEYQYALSIYFLENFTKNLFNDLYMYLVMVVLSHKPFVFHIFENFDQESYKISPLFYFIYFQQRLCLWHTRLSHEWNRFFLKLFSSWVNYYCAPLWYSFAVKTKKDGRDKAELMSTTVESLMITTIGSEIDMVPQQDTVDEGTKDKTRTIGNIQMRGR